METNDFLLYNEVLYRLHACRTMEELKPTLLGQLKLMIPYTYASFLSIQVDPETQELIHRDPFCQPRQFEAADAGQNRGQRRSGNGRLPWNRGRIRRAAQARFPAFRPEDRWPALPHRWQG